MKHCGSRILKTERLVLRPFTRADAEDMYNHWAGDPLVSRYLTWAPHRNVEETRALLAQWEKEYSRPDHYSWAIVSGGVAVGSIAAVRLEEESGFVTLGYCLSRRLWGRGYMTEAVRAVCSFFFREAGASRITADYVAENVASGRVLEKCGFRREELLRGAWRLLSTGEEVDLVRCGLRREAFFS